MAAILDCFFYLQLQNNNIKMDYRDKIQLKKWCFQFINSYRSFTRTLAITSYGTEKIETDVDLRGIGEGDLSNSSSWWDNASSDGRCGGVGLGGAFFLKEDFFAGDFFAGFLGDFFPLPRPLPRPRPLPAIRRIWWDWSKWMISIYNNAVVDCREEWWERRLPTSFYTLWIDVMRSPTKR